MIPVFVDIKPQSCPNPLNKKQKGVLPVAVLGTEDFDVGTIDPVTLRLTIDAAQEGVAPLRWNYEDVATPFEGDPPGCHELGPDGYMDLTLKFSVPELVEELGLCDFGDRELVELTVVGNLKGEVEGELGLAIRGSDWVLILEKPGK